MTDRLTIGIIGDGFMQPGFFETALREQLPGRALTIRSMEVDWPLRLKSTKYDPTLPVGEFVGRPEDYFDFLADLDILVTHLAPITADSLDHAPRLKAIAVSRGGPVNIEMAAARARGIPVVNTPGRNASAVAEFTVGSLLAETRNLIRGHMAVASGRFGREFYHYANTGPELCELTVGIVGYGDIGTRVARLLQPFGCGILIYDPFKELTPEEKAAGFQKAELDDLMARADVVTLHPRVTPETKGMISRARIAMMKPGGYIVNTTRGQVLDYGALYDALVSGQLRGAALDTFEPEPPPADWPLLKLPNVTLSPHIAGASRHSAIKAATMIAGDIALILDGKPPLHPCK
ncbi:oxidoreductase (plasmid) [Paracoccus versutus]|uniref:D-3-phosphoglycerate dehydrogenase n=1 Tax=Paracoccus versutus TaxID=34007 RepID=A0AAQ0KJT9_PARVE|nr:2-hydroxyacid dehydrogenase [Paracoccus versutus]KGJ03134.1 oxidoreductase [Paracoccus versutus]REG31195.1 D-3-phosphoglycerate dehydrogenase [Paracoccus versutus]WEJ80587.1 oxidoreductase [Paracoccus versutus]